MHFGPLPFLSRPAYLEAETPPLMSSTPTYPELIDFLARGSSPEHVTAFRPLEAGQQRAPKLKLRKQLRRRTDTLPNTPPFGRGPRQLQAVSIDR